MKKAVFLKSNQLDALEREAPTVYLYYFDTAFGSYDYVEYRNFSNRFFIKKTVMQDIRSRVYFGGLSYNQLMKALKLGATYGVFDLREKVFHKANGTAGKAEQNRTLFILSLVHHDYTIENLLDQDNFGMRDGFLYSKISYQEAQFIEAWLYIADQHKDFEPLFDKDYLEYLSVQGGPDMRLFGRKQQ